MSHGLMSGVVRTGQPFNTDEYVQEMGRRDSRVYIQNNNLHAWMGVPLNAGQTTALGCIAVATTDTTISYSEDQVRNYCNIPDPTAAANHNTRLHGPTEDAARQLQGSKCISPLLAR